MTIPRLKEQNIHNKCRLCGKRARKGTKIFADKSASSEDNASDQPKNLSDLIFDCLRFKIKEDDDLPKQVCSECERKLSSWLSFYTKCQQTQTALRQFSDCPAQPEESSVSVLPSNDETKVETAVLAESTQSSSKETKVEAVKEKPKVNEPKKVESTPKKKVDISQDYIQNCPLCEKQFTQQGKYARHIASHVSPIRPDSNNPIKLWPCPNCPKKLRSRDGLARHQETHTSERNYCCHVCGRLFQTLPCLLNHVRIQHSPETGVGAKPRHECNVCGRVFRQSTHLAQHFRTHTGERPYCCSECNSCFTTSGQLQRHAQAVHQGLKRFKCDLCGKEFLYSHNYKAHMQRHDGNKELQCEVCEKGFFTKNALFRHRRFHTGEKPFQCDICGKRFADCSNRKRHRQQHHKGAPMEDSKGLDAETTTNGQGSLEMLLSMPELLEENKTEEDVEEGKTFTSLRTFFMEDLLHVELVTFEDDSDDHLTLVRANPSLEPLDIELDPVEISLSLQSNPIDLTSSLEPIDPSPHDAHFTLQPIDNDSLDMTSSIEPSSPDDLSPSLQPMGQSPLHISTISLRSSPINMSPTLQPLDLSPTLPPIGESPLHMPTSDFLLNLHGCY